MSTGWAHYSSLIFHHPGTKIRHVHFQKTTGRSTFEKGEGVNRVVDQLCLFFVCAKAHSTPSMMGLENPDDLSSKYQHTDFQWEGAMMEKRLPERWMCLVVSREKLSQAVGRIIRVHKVSCGVLQPQDRSNVRKQKTPQTWHNDVYATDNNPRIAQSSH